MDGNEDLEVHEAQRFGLVLLAAVTVQHFQLSQDHGGIPVRELFPGLRAWSKPMPGTLLTIMSSLNTLAVDL